MNPFQGPISNLVVYLDTLSSYKQVLHFVLGFCIRGFIGSTEQKYLIKKHSNYEKITYVEYMSRHCGNFGIENLRFSYNERHNGFVEIYTLDGKLHRLDGPSQIQTINNKITNVRYNIYGNGILDKPHTSWDEQGKIINQTYSIDDFMLFLGYDTDGNVLEENFSSKNKFHRTDGPTYTYFYPNGSKNYEIYYKNGQKHRDVGPAYIWYGNNGEIMEEKYYQNGVKHREYGPAIIYYIDGKITEEKYYKHGKHVNSPSEN